MNSMTPTCRCESFAPLLTSGLLCVHACVSACVSVFALHATCLYIYIYIYILWTALVTVVALCADFLCSAGLGRFAGSEYVNVLRDS
jgi:hypothetical protein